MNIYVSIILKLNFKHIDSINNIKNSIIQRRKELINIRNWIINSNNDFTIINNEFCVRADRLPRSRFGERKGL